MEYVNSLNKQLKKEGLEFIPSKEYQTKIKGVIVSKEIDFKMNYELEKTVQVTRYDSCAKSIKGMFEMYSKLIKSGEVKE